MLARPGDLELRRVYGDRLLEQGDDQGAFVHAQCQLEATDRTDPSWSALHAKCERMLFRRGAAWSEALLGDLWSPLWGTAPSFGFRRGLAESVQLAWRDQAAEALSRLAARTPLRQAGLHPAPKAELRAMLQAVAAARVPRVHVLRALPERVATVPARELARLRACDLAPFEGLGLVGTRFGSDELGFERFAALLHQTRLRSLSLTNFPLTPSNVAQLAQVGAFGSLEELVLTRPMQHGLHELELGPMLAIPGGPLDLTVGWRVEGAQLDALLRWRPLVGLRLSQLSSEDTLQRLLDWPGLVQLERLGLGSHFIGPRQLAQPLARVPFERLTALQVEETGAGPETMQELARSEALRSLQELDLARSQVGDAGFEALAQFPPGRLVSLTLNVQGVTERGMRALAQWRGLEHVTTLHLSGWSLDHGSVGALIEAPWFDPVRLEVHHLGARDIDRLRERFGAALVT